MAKHRHDPDAPAAPAPERESAKENAKELDRIILFSDAVFAIAITLLILEIRVPELARETAADRMPHALLELLPKFMGFFISFWMIAIYWVFHHQMCRHLRRYSRALIMLNFLFLMWIVFLPFSAGLFSTYFRVPLANVIYSLNLTVTGICLWLFWRHAAGGRRLIDPALTDREIHFHGLRALLIPAVYLLSVPIALWMDLKFSRQVWILIGPAMLALRKRYPDLMK